MLDSPSWVEPSFWVGSEHAQEALDSADSGKSRPTFATSHNRAPNSGSHVWQFAQHVFANPRAGTVSILHTLEITLLIGAAHERLRTIAIVDAQLLRGFDTCTPTVVGCIALSPIDAVAILGTLSRACIETTYQRLAAIRIERAVAFIGKLATATVVLVRGKTTEPRATIARVDAFCATSIETAGQRLVAVAIELARFSDPELGSVAR